MGKSRKHTGEKVEPNHRAAIHARKALGQNTSQITRSVPYSYNTVKAVLRQQDNIDTKLVDRLIKREAAELALAGGLARTNLLKRLASGGGNIIENIAVMDKTFQQRRLLSGLSTQNHAVMTIIDKVESDIKDLEVQEAKLIQDINS